MPPSAAITLSNALPCSKLTLNYNGLMVQGHVFNKHGTLNHHNFINISKKTSTHARAMPVTTATALPPELPPVMYQSSSSTPASSLLPVLLQSA